MTVAMHYSEASVNSSKQTVLASPSEALPPMPAPQRMVSIDGAVPVELGGVGVPSNWRAQAMMPGKAPQAAYSSSGGTTSSGVGTEAVADSSTLTWLNMLLGWIWPKANQALIRYVHKELTPRLRETLPGPFKNAGFSRFTLGKNTPDFGPIEVIRHSDSHVQVDLNINYFSDVDVMLDAGAISLGISQLTFCGRLSLVLRPLLDKLPVIGGVKLFFVDNPRLTLQFAGLAALAEFPGIAEQVKGAVDDAISRSLVLPNSKIIHLTRDESIVDMLEITSHPPLGVFRARVARGRNLAGANWSALTTADRFTSDPYCVLSLGSKTHKTSVRPKTNDPAWPASEPSGYFVVQHREQSLGIQVYDSDPSPFKITFLGSTSITVGATMSKWPTGSGKGNETLRSSTLTLDTSQVNKDMLHVNDPVSRGEPSYLDMEVEWFDLAEPGPTAAQLRTASPARPGEPVALLLVDLCKGSGFPKDYFFEKKGLRWQCLADNGDPVPSQRGEICQMEEIRFPELPIHPRLFRVIDKLLSRGMSEQDIASIVGVEVPAMIQVYQKLKAEFDQKHQERQRNWLEDKSVNLQWFETLAVLISQPEKASFTLQLMDGEDRHVANLGPFPIRELLSGSGMMPRGRHKTAPAPSMEGSGMTSWLRRAPKPVDPQLFVAVEMEIAARLHFLVPGRGPSHMPSQSTKSEQPNGRSNRSII
eukprot:gnl/TRDRNA2_/TRDRNA2_198503_c0_seq1.p1 gnl/TRDRNA2_/TRDRNA2_198503_c0~~gnl/TRDRNA2_/TRDRNA2_198503_c0_seq1.p1  ORF type:complete len:702 (+),score=102.47 gnl/TRDRNA2_/TRDRNA2_198503_c0_seq1:140-2245(+)